MKMRDEDPSLAPSPTTPLTVTKPKTRENPDAAGACNGKVQYKFWVLAAIILLALWSMFTGSVTLKWSATNLTRFSDDFDSRILDDLDVLEVEEREKVVRRMWDVYSHSHSHSHSRLPRFWCDAFQAAYEHLVSDAHGVRDAAVSEIAKMSLRSLHLQKHRLPLQESHVQSILGSRKMKQAESGLDIKADSDQ